MIPKSIAAGRLSGLLDVNITSPANGDVLIYDSVSGKWINFPAGSIGNVVGPASSTDNAIARYDGTTGKLIQNSAATIDDSGNLTANTGIFIGGVQITANPFTGIVQTIADTNLNFFINGSNPFTIDNGGNQSNVDMNIASGFALRFDASNYIYSADSDHVNVRAKKNLSLMIGGATVVDITSSSITLLDGVNIATGTTTGSKIFNTAAQKGALWGATPIVQPISSTAIDTLLVNTGIRASGGLANFDTDIKASVVGKGFYVKEGTNATMGVATLVGGTAVVNTTKVTANSRIFLTAQSLGTVTLGQGLAVSARTPGTSFTILSQSAIDTSVVAWIIFEPS